MDFTQIVIEPSVAFAVAGATGGLLRTINWQIEHKGEPVNLWKVARNLIVGGVSGYAMNGTYVAAFTAGLSGEWIFQNILNKANKLTGCSEKCPSLKSIVE